MKKSSKIRNKYDYKDVARILGATYITIARLCREGKMKSTLIAGKYYVNKSDLDIYMNKESIFNRPKAEIIDIIKEGLQVANKENMIKIEYMIKEMVCKILEKNIEKNLKKIDQNNSRLEKTVPEGAMKHIRYRGEEIKKEFAKIK